MEICVECKRDTSAGSGLFIDRIPADRYKDDGTYIDSYLCRECLDELEKEFEEDQQHEKD
tara:strand:- start:728 stop:907 length:180 start_codon:yes stop_codon:yes gene_type:complete